MSFSNKEKKVLIIVLLTTFFVFYLRFFFLGQLNSILTMKKEMHSLRADKDDYEIAAIKYQHFDSEITKMISRLNKVREMYPPELRDDFVLSTVRKTATKAKLNIVSINLNQVRSADISRRLVAYELEGVQYVQITDRNLLGLLNTLGLPETPTATSVTSLASGASSGASSGAEFASSTAAGSHSSDSKKEGTASPAEASGQNSTDKSTIKLTPDSQSGTNDPENRIRLGEVYLREIDINTKSSYSEIKSFIKLIESLPNRVITRRFNIMKNKEGDLSSTITIAMFGIKDTINDVDEKSVKPTETRTKNIFAGTTSDATVSSDSAKADTARYTISSKFDFAARLQPFGFGLNPQTLSISGRTVQSGSNGKKPIVVSDNASNDTAYIRVDGDSGSSYSTYFKAGKDAFPTSSPDSKQEFIPSGKEITLIIDSTVRKHSYDNTTVNFDIENNSDKLFRVIIFNDDPQKPRAKVTKKTSNILVDERRT